MKKPLLFFLFISLNVFGQGEISKFEFETSYSIAPVASFSYNKNHYIISNYYDTNSSTLKIYALHLLKFDHNYKYISRQRIKFKKFSLNNIIIKSLKEIKPGVYNIVFFNKTPTSYECISSIFNLNSLEITNYKIKYIISFSEIVNPKFFKIISDNEKTYFLNLQPKQKVLTIYSLFENSYAKKSITLENDFLKNMKLSIGSLKNGREANNYLDTPIRTQYYVKDNYLYLINGHCPQGDRKSVV